MSKPTTPFYGRERELRRLEKLAHRKTASIAVIKGRRRIGKSRLVQELARRLHGYRVATFQGLPPSKELTAQMEREDFAAQVPAARHPAAARGRLEWTPRLQPCGMPAESSRLPEKRSDLRLSESCLERR